MATIDRRKTGTGEVRYRVQVRIKGFPPAVETFDRLTDAREWAGRTEADIKRGLYLPEAAGRRHTLADLLTAYVENRRAVGAYDPRRVGQLEFWRGTLGAYALAEVTPARIAMQRDALMQGATRSGRKATPATAKRYLAALSHVFTYAERELGWISNNPVRRVAKPREAQGRVRFLDKETELPRLLAACREASDRRLYPIVVLALATGARQGELLGLRWADIDTERAVATLHKTKNKDRRGLHLTAQALGVLSQLRAVRRIGTDYIFAGPRSGSGTPTFEGLRDAWALALAEASIENFRFHDLRHCAASYLIMSGASLAEVAEVLGHRTLSMVKRYAHMSTGHVRGVVDRMADAFLAGATEAGA